MGERVRKLVGTLALMLGVAFGGMATPAYAVDAWLTNADQTIYTIVGAEYTVYSDQACTKSVGVLTTTEDGSTNQLTLSPGTYYVVETKVPAGLEQDPAYTKANPHTLVIKSGETTTIRSTDKAGTMHIKVRKHDYSTGEVAEGDASLDDGKFLVRCYAGQRYASKVQCEAATPSVSYEVDSVNDKTLEVPYGTILVTEEKQPTGMTARYNPDPAGDDYAIFFGSQTEALTYVAGNDYARSMGSATKDDGTIRIGDVPLYGIIEVDKRDADLTAVQGDATLEGATYRVFNMSDKAVTVGTQSFATHKGADVTKLGEDDAVCSMTTDDKGVATSPALPYGTYAVVEVDPSTGYGIDSTVHTVTVHPATTGQTAKVVSSEPVKRGSLTIEKQDVTFGATASGNATFEGAEFTVANASDSPVSYNGKSFAKDEVLTTVTTGKDGKATVGNLPYATYTVTETKAPRGYRVPANASKDVPVHDATTAPVQFVQKDPTFNSNLTLHKTSGGKTALGTVDMSGATFEVYNMSDGPIDYNGRKVASGADSTTHTKNGPDYIATITTDADGTATLDKLPIGIYGIIETKAPQGAKLYSESHERTKGVDMLVSLTRGSSSTFKMDDEPLWKPLRIAKTDADITVAQGNASLAGAQFEVKNAGDTDLLVKSADGTQRTVKPGETIETVTAKDHDDGTYATLASQLQYGCKVSITETKAPTGYLLNDTTYLATIATDGTVTQTTLS